MTCWLVLVAHISRLQIVRNRKVPQIYTDIRQPRLPFCDMKLTLFCVSTASGLVHDVFQYVSAHPIPIEICYGMLSDVKDTNTFSLSIFFLSVADVGGRVLISWNTTFVDLGSAVIA
jgi:hypothetical protein